MDLKIYNTGFLGVNTYLLTDEISKESIIVDLGGDFEPIIKDIEKFGYKLKFILNTHGHFDHIYGEGKFQEKYPNIPIYMSKNDIQHVEKMQDDLNMWGINTNAVIVKPTKFIDESTNLYIGNSKIHIYETPGHSKGGLCYHIENILFSGDTLFQRSIGRTDFYGGDYDTIINSIKTKLLILDDNTSVYPGHGPKTTIGEEKKYNSYII